MEARGGLNIFRIIIIIFLHITNLFSWIITIIFFTDHQSNFLDAVRQGHIQTIVKRLLCSLGKVSTAW